MAWGMGGGKRRKWELGPITFKSDCFLESERRWWWWYRRWGWLEMTMTTKMMISTIFALSLGGYRCFSRCIFLLPFHFPIFFVVLGCAAMLSLFGLCWEWNRYRQRICILFWFLIHFCCQGNSADPHSPTPTIRAICMPRDSGCCAKKKHTKTGDIPMPYLEDAGLWKVYYVGRTACGGHHAQDSYDIGV